METGEFDDWDAVLRDIAWPNTAEDGHGHAYTGGCFCIQCGINNDTPAHAALCLMPEWHARPGDFISGLEV